MKPGQDASGMKTGMLKCFLFIEFSGLKNR